MPKSWQGEYRRITHWGRPDITEGNAPDCQQLRAAALSPELCSGPDLLRRTRRTLRVRKRSDGSDTAVERLTSVSIRKFTALTPTSILLLPGRLHNGPPVLGPGGRKYQVPRRIGNGLRPMRPV